MAPVHHGPRVVPIERRDGLSVSEFRRRFMRRREPVVVRGCLDGTLALEEWTPQYFGSRYGSTQVRIASPPRLTSSCGYTDSTLGEYVASLEAGQVGRKYLSQWRAFDRFPELEESLPTPGYVQPRRKIMRSIWIGPADTYIGFHVDNHTAFDGVGNIFTRPDCRGQGLARIVTGSVVAGLRQTGIRTIGLNVEQTNAAAIRVYERIGFQTRLCYYEGVADRV